MLCCTLAAVQEWVLSKCTSDEQRHDAALSRDYAVTDADLGTLKMQLSQRTWRLHAEAGESVRQLYQQHKSSCFIYQAQQVWSWCICMMPSSGILGCSTFLLHPAGG